MTNLYSKDTYFMIRIRNYLPFVVAALVGAAILGAPTQAQAGFSMTLSDSDGNFVTVNDNSLADSDSRSGVIGFFGALGSFNIQLSVGTSNAPGTEHLAQLTINNTSISSAGFNGDKTITLTLEDTGFTSPQPQPGKPVTMDSQLATTALPTGSTVTFQSFLDGAAGTKLILNKVDGASVSDEVFVSGNPFTLKNITTYTVKGQGANIPLTVQSSGITVAHLPAPAGVVLAMTGLPVVGLACWLRRKAKVQNG
jgi:hypothetical protein